MRRYSTESDRFAIERAKRAVQELRGERIPYAMKFWIIVGIAALLVVAFVTL